jgi:putative oxidoreductase
MKRWLVFFASLGFGALFLWSGVAKVKDPVSFAEAIRNFRLVGDPIAPALAHFIPWLEIFAGAAVMCDRTRQGASALLTLLLLGLTGAVVSAWIRGLDIACGCFGGEESIDYPVKVAQNFGLILWGAVLFFFSRSDRAAPRPDAETRVRLGCG